MRRLRRPTGPRDRSAHSLRFSADTVPGLVGLFALSPSAPWLVVALAVAVGAVWATRLARRLPAGALSAA